MSERERQTDRQTDRVGDRQRWLLVIDWMPFHGHVPRLLPFAPAFTAMLTQHAEVLVLQEAARLPEVSEHLSAPSSPHPLASDFGLWVPMLVPANVPVPPFFFRAFFQRPFILVRATPHKTGGTSWLARPPPARDKPAGLAHTLFGGCVGCGPGW